MSFDVKFKLGCYHEDKHQLLAFAYLSLVKEFCSQDKELSFHKNEKGCLPPIRRGPEATSGTPSGMMT